ncbi:MAG: alpha/beta fold hydrolase [Pseudomonadota bacterium]
MTIQSKNSKCINPSVGSTRTSNQLAFEAIEVSDIPGPDIRMNGFDESLSKDSFSATAAGEVLDRSFHAGLARLTQGISPAGLMAAYFDWAAHLWLSPGKQFELTQKALRKAVRLNRYAIASALSDEPVAPCIEPLEQDKRFSGEAWQRWPFNLIYQSFLLQQQWWHNASCGLPGLNKRHADIVSFSNRQLLDFVSPSNFLLTNPELIEATTQRLGTNLLQGAANVLHDSYDATTGRLSERALTHAVGKDVAATPGNVIYRNDLMELIHFAPDSEQVRATPILIVPAWIMKYYILDLSPHNSLVRHLVEQGFDVFMISWRNPGPEHRDFSFDDYRRHGPMTAIDVITKSTGERSIHAAGYCLGGTLLAITASAMARDNDARLKSVTLLAAQTDFSSPGELGLFIGESQIAFLEDMMWEQGFLDTHQMAGAFQILRSNDLVWSRLVRDYLLGERAKTNDLMSWNADATRMPFRMHSEYLRRLFLNNELADGRFMVDGRAVSLQSIEVPLFVLATERDHVSPWRSVYRIHHDTRCEVTFVLTSGGHNGGIISEPGHPGRRYRMLIRPENGQQVIAERWTSLAENHDGSWWLPWADWLIDNSSAEMRKNVLPGCVGPNGHRLPEALCPAPGTYVHEH